MGQERKEIEGRKGRDKRERGVDKGKIGERVDLGYRRERKVER